MSVLPPLREEFVLTGQVKVEVRTIAILGAGSFLAAQAAECANEQALFWEFYDALYANQPERGSGGFSAQTLKALAQALGLETAAFGACLDSGKYAAKIQSDTGEAQRRGVSKTPTILLNGLEVGTTLDALRAAILRALPSGS